MEWLKRHSGFLKVLVGAIGVVLLACTACCVPIFAPLLAWAGIAFWSGEVSGAWLTIGAGTIATLWLITLYRRRCRRPCSTSPSEGKSTSCKSAGG